MMRHNKKRNTKLLYEFLAMHAAELVLDNKNPHQIIGIVKKYFANGSILSEENQLFDVILNCKKDKNTILKTLKEVKKFSNRIDVGKLDLEKTSLISEIKRLKFDNMYNHKIDDYRLLASIQLFINNSRTDKIKESINNIQLENTIVDLLVNNKQNNNNHHIKQPNFNFLAMVDSITNDLRNLDQIHRNIILEFIDNPSKLDERLEHNAKNIVKYANKFSDCTNKKINKFLRMVCEAKQQKDKFIKLLESEELIAELKTNE